MNGGIFDNPVARDRISTTADRIISVNPLIGLLASTALLGIVAAVAFRPQVISSVRLIRNGGWVSVVRLGWYGDNTAPRSFSNVIGYGRGSTADGARRDAIRIASMFQKQGVRVRIDTPTYQRESYEF